MHLRGVLNFNWPKTNNIFIFHSVLFLLTNQFEFVFPFAAFQTSLNQISTKKSLPL